VTYTASRSLVTLLKQVNTLPRFLMIAGVSHRSACCDDGLGVAAAAVLDRAVVKLCAKGMPLVPSPAGQ
jgi:hypothetical protein